MIVDPDFLDHWKTRVLVDMLGGDELAPVYVIRLWAHCQNRKQSIFQLEKPNGNPTVNPDVTQRKPIVNHALKALCKYAGEAEKFVDSLVSAGFVEITSDGGGFEVVGWSRHNAQLVAAWENGARGGRPAKKPTGNPTVTHGKPNANPSETDKRREEKIGEDKTRSEEEESMSPSGDDPPTDDFDKFVEEWNELDGVTRGVSLNASRRKAFKTRCKDKIGGRTWLEVFRADIKAKFPFKCSSGPDAWRPDIDWFLKPGSLISILEGKYDWSKDDGKRKTAAVGHGQVFGSSEPKPADFGRMY